MALSHQILPFLRPLSASRPSTYRPFLRFSTASKLHAEPSKAPTISANPIATPSSHPPSDAPIQLQATQEASRAADLAATEAGTESDSAQAPAPKPELPSERPKAPKAQESKPAQPLKYHVARTVSGNLPIYPRFKKGGNDRTTLVRRVTGDTRALRDEIARLLRANDKKDVVINPLTGAIVVKGLQKDAIQKYLESRGL